MRLHNEIILGVHKELAMFIDGGFVAAPSLGWTTVDAIGQLFLVL
jgi:hypothetical protein